MNLARSMLASCCQLAQEWPRSKALTMVDFCFKALVSDWCVSSMDHLSAFMQQHYS